MDEPLIASDVLESKIAEVKQMFIKYRRVLVDFSMGSGKSKIAIDLINSDSKDVPGYRAIIIADGKLGSKDVWPKEIEKWGLDCDYDIVTYIKASNMKNKTYNLVILDEAHRITNVSFKFFLNNRVKGVLALTGTVPIRNLDKKELLSRITKNHIVSLSINEAHNIQRINDYAIYGIEIGDPTFAEYLAKCQSIERKRNKFTILARQWYIYKHPAKFEFTKRLHQYFKDSGIRTLTYCNTQEQANEIDDNAYHSGTDHEIFDAFVASRISSMAVVDMVTTGANIFNLKVGILMQAFSEHVKFKQRAGRFFRLLDKNDTAHLFVPYLRDTQDQTWFQRSVMAMDGWSKTKVFQEHVFWDALPDIISKF